MSTASKAGVARAWRRWFWCEPADQPTRSRVNAEFGTTRDVSRPPPPEPLPVPVIDNHCHLDIEDGESWLDPAALEQSTAVGVIGCDLPGDRAEHGAIVAGVAL